MTSFGWDTVPRRAVGLKSRGSGSEQPFHDRGTSFPEHPVTWWGWVSPGPLVPDPPDSYFADARGGVTPDHQYSSKSHGENTGRERTAAQIPNVETPGFPHLTNADARNPLQIARADTPESLTYRMPAIRSEQAFFCFTGDLLLY